MLRFILFFSLISTFLYPQNKTTKIETIDSVLYYTNLRELNVKKNNYKEALFFSQKAINYSKTHKKTESLAIATFNLGKLYYDVKKYSDAVNAFEKSIHLFEKLPPSITQANCYYYIGMCYMKKGSFDIAYNYFDKAQLMYASLKSSDYVDLINLQKAIIYNSKGRYELASTVLKSIIAKPNNQVNIDCKSEALLQIGIIEMAQNRNNLALNYFDKALELNAKGVNLEQKSAILLALSTVYEKMLDKNNAYTYLKQHSNLDENISITDNKKLGVDEYEKFKESERIKEERLEKEQKLQQEKATKFSKLISILAIALISILSLLSLALYKNNIIRTQSNLLLEEKNRELIIAKESAEKASKARSEFLSTVSHELRTPLNAINGIAHLLLEEKPKKSQLHYLKSLEFSGNYLTTFINDILEIQKIDSNKIEIEKIDFNLKMLIENIQNSLKELASKNNNNFTLEIDSKIPDNLIGDPTKLSQIILNLINNALKFTKNGFVKLTTKLVALEDKNAIVYFEVQDNGIGIPEDKLESVFKSFSQGSVGINRKYGGTGLGLTIVKKLIELLGGEIKVKSTVGKGSSFSFELHFIESEKEFKVEKKIKTYDDSILLNKKILIVEDNKINQMVSKKMLKNKGIHCEIIDNGEEAIEIAKNNKFDLILMDVHLPGINGTIATQEIRKFDQTTPVIALTAISLNENRDMLLSYGMNDVITKPFVPEEFYSIIAKYI